MVLNMQIVNMQILNNQIKELILNLVENLVTTFYLMMQMLLKMSKYWHKFQGNKIAWRKIMIISDFLKKL